MCEMCEYLYIDKYSFESYCELLDAPCDGTNNANCPILAE